MQRAAVVAVGTELALGLRIDTNGPAISRQIAKAGYLVDEMDSIEDDVGALTDTFRRLCGTYPLVVVTGGLGPTHDDLTRDAAAAALGLKMSYDEDIHRSLDAAAQRFHDAGSDPAISREVYRMALVLDGARVLPPITGMAPGQVISTPAGKLVLLPGPPKECLPILDSFLAEIDTAGSGYVDLACFGITESEVQHIVQPLLKDLPGIVFTVLASPASTHVVLTDSGEGEVALQSVAHQVESALGSTVYGHGEQTLAQVVFEIARQKKLVLATAESCTGGLVGSSIVDVPGSSQVFAGGVISYSNEVKAEVLKVSRDDLETYGAVSSQVAAQMADGVRRLLHADIAVSTTGVAGPDGGTPEKPVGTVWFGISTAEGTRTQLRTRGGTRELVRARSANTALDFVRRTMLGLPLESELDTAF